MSPHKLMRYGLLGLFAFVALAAEPPPQPCAEEGIKVCVLVILATDKNDKVDKRIECIAKEVQKMKIDPKLTGFEKLTGFHLDKMMCQESGVGNKINFKLIEDQSVDVTVEQGANKEGRVQV